MEMKRHTIEASLMSFKDGLKVYEGLHAIRIRSSRVNELIMSDHSPMLGEIDGDLILFDGEKETRLENVHGFFIHNKNIFKFFQSGEE